MKEGQTVTEESGLVTSLLKSIQLVSSEGGDSQTDSTGMSSHTPAAWSASPTWLDKVLELKTNLARGGMEDAKCGLGYAERTSPAQVTWEHPIGRASWSPIGWESCYKQVFGMSDRHHRHLHRLLTGDVFHNEWSDCWLPLLSSSCKAAAQILNW